MQLHDALCLTLLSRIKIDLYLSRMIATKYDYVFAGFGLSGMSLLYELSKDNYFTQKEVLIIERDAKKENDRTWSFWTDVDHDFLHLAKKSWRKGVFFALDGSSIPLDMHAYSYYTIEGIDFYNFILNHCKQFKNITWIQDSVNSISDEGVVVTSHNEFLGELVFRSYFDKAYFSSQKSNYFLWQHFYGYVIKTPQASFDEHEFTLMDYRFSDKKRTNFFYVLPYANDEALVEFTEFSAKLYTTEEYKQKLEDYIRNVLKISDYTIIHKEYNAIPMSDFQLDMRVSKHVLNIGSLAGYVKPSSGYAFTRTLIRNKRLAQGILQKDSNIAKKIDSSKVNKAFDNAILYLMQYEKVHGGLVFASLFKKLNADFVFKFLDEKSSPLELFRIMLSSPKKWEFIKYFLKRQGS